MKAPFSQPRLLPDDGVEGADVLEKETAGSSAPPGPATSLSWEGMLAPLPPTTGQENWTKHEVAAVRPQMCRVPQFVPVVVGQLIDILKWTVFSKRWWHFLRSRHRLIILQTLLQMQPSMLLDDVVPTQYRGYNWVVLYIFTHWSSTFEQCDEHQDYTVSTWKLRATSYGHSCQTRLSEHQTNKH